MEISPEFPLILPHVEVDKAENYGVPVVSFYPYHAFKISAYSTLKKRQCNWPNALLAIELNMPEKQDTACKKADLNRWRFFAGFV